MTPKILLSALRQFKHNDGSVMVTWRDLEIGEEKKVGDRFFGPLSTWIYLTHEHVAYAPSVSSSSYPMQRRVLADDGSVMVKGFDHDEIVVLVEGLLERIEDLENILFMATSFAKQANSHSASIIKLLDKTLGEGRINSLRR